jgi:hypothetical protein
MFTIETAINVWVFSPTSYGLWGFTGLWVLGPKSLPTNLVDRISYGISKVMGYNKYGL